MASENNTLTRVILSFCPRLDEIREIPLLSHIVIYDGMIWFINNAILKLHQN